MGVLPGRQLAAIRPHRIRGHTRCHDRVRPNPKAKTTILRRTVQLQSTTKNSKNGGAQRKKHETEEACAAAPGASVSFLGSREISAGAPASGRSSVNLLASGCELLVEYFKDVNEEAAEGGSGRTARDADVYTKSAWQIQDLGLVVPSEQRPMAAQYKLPQAEPLVNLEEYPPLS